MSLCYGLLRAFGAAMLMLCASWLVVGICVFPFEFSNQGIVFGRGLSECRLSCVFVFVCVVARFVLVQLGSHVDSNVFVCVKPVSVYQATCGTGFV